MGIVGKPSVGKSTFFNAVTRATGALAAKVAAHPFTTIDPNVREGLCALLLPGGEPETLLGVERSRWSEGSHGRDAADRRLHPVLLKDVAGLVPGAYKGRARASRRTRVKEILGFIWSTEWVYGFESTRGAVLRNRVFWGATRTRARVRFELSISFNQIGYSGKKTQRPGGTRRDTRIANGHRSRQGQPVFERPFGRALPASNSQVSI